MQIRFKIAREVEEMLAAFPLIIQLTPTIKMNFYVSCLNEMVKNGYFQIHVFDEQNNLIAVSGIWIGAKLYCGKYLEMDNVVVDQSYRSKGIGEELYLYIEQLANHNQCSVIMLDAYKENTRAHDFYTKFGFVARGFHFIKQLNHE